MTPSVSSPPAGAIGSYLVDGVRFPFCKGCGHTGVLRKLNDALVALQIPFREVTLVTDIGCIGLADNLFRDVHTVHTTHGRSTAFATGIALADTVLGSGRLKLVVLIGDGGAMIGLQHLVHAAMLNVDITVLICNNFVYGMTGGQGSGLTPERFVTATTPGGNIVPPADICGILLNSRAPFVARTVSTEPGLSETIRDAIAFPGCAVVEVLEMCTEFAVPDNQLTGKKLREIADANAWSIGRLREDRTAVPFERRYAFVEPPEGPPRQVAPGSRFRLDRKVSLTVAGSAGEKVQSAAAVLCTESIRGGLYATQKNDNPVTQGTGFSIADVSVGPDPIRFTGVAAPDIVIVTSEDGLRELRARGTWRAMTPDTMVIADVSIADGGLPTRTVRLPLRSTFTPQGAALAGVLVAGVARCGLPIELMQSVASRRLNSAPEAFDPLLDAVSSAR